MRCLSNWKPASAARRMSRVSLGAGIGWSYCTRLSRSCLRARAAIPMTPGAPRSRSCRRVQTGGGKRWTGIRAALAARPAEIVRATGPVVVAHTRSRRASRPASTSGRHPDSGARLRFKLQKDTSASSRTSPTPLRSSRPACLNGRRGCWNRFTRRLHYVIV